jgi:Ca2+-binding RTX toxin-like protein
MSADNLESIEENGDYWLSKSNTAYHIINPNATNLTTIEANGYYSLAKGGDTYYVLDGSGSSIRLYYDGVGRSMFGPHDSTGIYTPTNVEENPFDSGFLVLVYRNDKPEWNNSSFFNYNNFGFEFDTLGKYAGSDLKTVNNHAFPRPGIEYEPVFGLDLNDDDNIATGANPPNLLNISTIQHHIDDGHVNDGIILKRDSVTIDPNSYAGWSATQVIASVGEGYEVLWSHSSKYDVWKFDTSGNFVSSIKAKLWQDEEKFNLDLNGDGDTGLQPVEEIGGVHLKHGDNTYNGAPQYYIVDGSNAPIGLSVRGAPRGPTDGGWNVTQVEDSGTGYEVFWSHNSGKFQVWKVDSSGSYETKVTAHLWQHENTFEVDLNGDGIDSGNNDIYGSIGNDTFDGGAGDDIINGREGHDTLIGGEGNDWISGDGGSGYAGNDILFGNAGNDDLRGRGGNDQIDGGAGSDTITTGSGFDKIILRIGDGGNTLSDADIITDFTDGIDKLRLDGGLLFSQDMINQGTGAYASDTIISKGSEYLAILQGIDVSLLSDTDFETVDIA